VIDNRNVNVLPCSIMRGSARLAPNI